MLVYGSVVREGRIDEGVFEYSQGTFKKVGKYPKLSIKPITKNHKDRSEFRDNEALMRFERDLDGIYFFDAVDGLDAINQFLDEDGQLDVYKVYYQGADLELCYQLQDIAYKCLDFNILMSDDYLKDFPIDLQYKFIKLKEFASDIIDLYKKTRLESLSNSDLHKVKVLLGKTNPKNPDDRELLYNIEEVDAVAYS